MTITLNINKPINNELFIYIKSKYACKFNSVHFRCNKQEFTLYCSILGSTYKPNEIFDKLDPVEKSGIVTGMVAPMIVDTPYPKAPPFSYVSKKSNKSSANPA